MRKGYKYFILSSVLILSALDLLFTIYAIDRLYDTDDSFDSHYSHTVNSNLQSELPEYDIYSVQSDSSVIAIVNLDEGATYNGQFDVYSNQIIQFPENNCSYEYASLSDAEAGISDGRYGAYIIVPATFSTSIISINSDPSPCNLDYVISESASEPEVLIAGVYDFYINLNNRVSYMYLANILSDFHTAQDNAVTVINNDITDYNAMIAVHPNDLTNALVLSETPLPVNNTPPLDVTNCWQTMSAAVNNINAQYTNATNVINSNIDTINDASTTLQSSLSDFRTSLDSSELLLDDIAYISEISYDQQQEIIASAIDESVVDNSVQSLSDLENDIDLLEDCLEPSIVAYINDHMGDYVDLSASVDIPMDGSNMCVFTIGECVCDCSIEDGIINISASDLRDFINDINNHYNADLQNSQIRSSSEVHLQDIYLIDAEGNGIDSSNVTLSYLLENIHSNARAISPDVFEEQAVILYDVYSSSLQGAVNGVNSQISDVNDRIYSIRLGISTDIDTSTSALSAYSSFLRNNRLSFPGNIATADLNSIANALYSLQQAVNDNNNAYIGYASDLHAAEVSNLSILRQNIFDAYNLSEQSIADGLSNAISIRTQTSAQNQLLMNDFIGMLPYTRLGTLENTSTYHFITSPITLTDASDN